MRVLVSNVDPRNIHPAEVLAAKINGMEGGAYKNLSDKSIFDAIDDLTNRHAFFGYECKQGESFFRGRVFSDSDLVENASDLLAPKAELVKSYGRCNYPNQRTLYLAKNLDTVLSELDVLKGSHVQFLHLKAKKEFTFFVVGEIDHYRRFEKGFFSYGQKEKNIKYIKSLIDNNDLERIYVDAFLAEQLARRDYSQAHYKLTSAIANVLFEDAKKANISNSANIAGFAYPSVSHRGGVNFVIMGDFFEYFEIVEATAIKINAHLNYNLYGRTPYASCQVIDDKGNLHWIICEGNLII